MTIYRIAKLKISKTIPLLLTHVLINRPVVDLKNLMFHKIFEIEHTKTKSVNN